MKKVKIIKVYHGKSDYVLMEIYRKYKLQLSIIGLIIGLIFLLLSAAGIFFNDFDIVKNNNALQEIFKTFGNYIYWLFIIMITLTIASAWIFGDLILKLRKFNNLIKSESKATFVRNQNELEELAWNLGPKYLDILNKRKRKFRIRN
jgi:hypothetical protein